MKNEKIIQITLGVGIGLLVFGLAVFAQRGNDVFSFENFRSPPFSLRNPSSEDRPMVEVVSAESNESLTGVGQEAEIPLTSVSMRLLPELIPRPFVGEGAQRLPSQMSSEEFRGADWRMPGWMPYYRDRKEMRIRSEGETSLIIPETVTSGVSKDLVRENKDLQSQTDSAISFSDGSLSFMGLREMENLMSSKNNLNLISGVVPQGDNRESFSSEFRESSLGLRGGYRESSSFAFRESSLDLRGGIETEGGSEKGQSSKRGGSELLVNLNGDEKPGKFKDYTQKAGNDTEVTDASKEKQGLTKNRESNTFEEDPGAILAKKNEEAREIERRPQEDRRFTAVEENTNLYDNDGTRFYAPGMKLGKFDVRFDLDNQLGYSDNFKATPKEQVQVLPSGVKVVVKNQQESAFTLSTSPSMVVASGERDPEITDALYMAFRYTPSLINFIDVDQKDILNHSVAFNAGYRFSKLALIVDQRVLPYSGGDIESGTFITRNFYVTSVSAEYEISDKTSLEAGLSNNIRDYKDGFDSQDTTLRAFANYSWSEKIRLGLGGSYGRATSQGGPDQDYQQALVRAVYFPTQKTTLFAESGLESRQFEHFSKDQNSLVFRSGGNLALFPKTTLSVNASRTQIPSAVTAGENVSATGIRASVSQALYQFTLGGGLGYESVSFIKTTNNSKNLADEQYYSLNLSGAYSLTDWWDLGLNYTHRITDKKKGENGENLDIESNQTTFSSRIQF